MASRLSRLSRLKAALGAPVARAALVASLAFVAACGGDDPVSPGPTQPGAFRKGVSISPRTFTLPGLQEFVARAHEAGELLTWAGAWNEVNGDSSSSPSIIYTLARGEDFVPVVEAAFYNAETGRLILPLTPEVRASYKNGAAAFADRHKPPYLALGIEVNLVADNLPTDFELFVDLFSETYDAVKAVSPSTKVFTIFQLEQLKGLRGGLFGGVNDTTTARWDLLDRFPKADLIGFTSYPGLIYMDPSEIPANYYAEIASRTSKPIAITELGWSANSTIAGWESDDAEQAGFVARFFELMEPLRDRSEMVVWSFLFDQELDDPFTGIGLRRPDGSARPAWDAWLD